MKISSSRNIFDLLYLDILENSMENILSLNCGEECRSLTSFLQHSSSRQTSIQSSPADHAECFSKFLELCFVKTLGEDIRNLFFCLSRHHLNFPFKYLFSYVVIMNFYVLGPCMEYRIFRQSNRRLIITENPYLVFCRLVKILH